MSSYFDDFKFIIEEIVRFRKIAPENWQKELSLYDVLSSVDAVDGRGSIICGEKAGARFRSIAEKAISKSPALCGKILPQELVPFLKQAFTCRILGARGTVTDKDITQLVRDARYAAKKVLQDRTFYIPCNLAKDSHQESFSIGPVRFTKPELAFEEIRESPLEHSDANLDGATEYYSQFNWVARISVEKSSPKLSSARAHEILELVFDALTATFSSSKSQQLGFKGGPPVPKRSFEVTANSNSGVQIVHNVSWQQHSLQDDWLSAVTELDFNKFLSAIGRILMPSIYDNPAFNLAHRFLNSLRWYGDAANDVNKSARIVKFTVAIEILLLTGALKDREKTRVFSLRGQALFAGLEEAKDAQAMRDFKWLYGIRSDIVHGRKRQGTITMSDVTRAERLCRLSLFYAIQLFEQIGFDSENKLESTFDELTRVNRGGRSERAK
ncbi:HEPN domain-containing protein [Thalassospira indica]|uniref:Apea-like HEPN domain-containing protein n=1 Tax=Thalassospira indica TaxID=1891279 RepID=A0ABM6XY16_9PROT|nr:HEPN domain-containing protein [Thalassospira indica]AXO14415.1 hypothetical protein DY252_09410 [Thalassospira indica]